MGTRPSFQKRKREQDRDEKRKAKEARKAQRKAEAARERERAAAGEPPGTLDSAPPDPPVDS